MVDACTIRRHGADVTDDFSGEITPAVTVIYSGKCRVQQHQATADEKDAGEDRQLLLRLEVQLPMSATGFKVADEVTMDTSASDPDLPGRVFLVHDLAHKTDATSRRLQCQERTG